MNSNMNAYYQHQVHLPRISGSREQQAISSSFLMQESNYSGFRHSRDSFHQEPGRQSDIVNRRPHQVISSHKKFHNLYAGPLGNFDNHANKIAAKMEKDKALMEDTPLSDQLRKEALRELPQCLTIKRSVKKKLSKSISQRSKRKPISFWKRLKYHTSINFNNFKYNVKNFNYFDLWHGTLKNIEGRFGSGYATYFKFLRWLFIMNFSISTVSLALLAIPQIIYDASSGNETIKNSESFQFQDLFIGQGFFNNTILYYGHYTDNIINSIPHLFYDMPAAYFSVTVLLCLISLVILAVSVAQSYRRTFIETEGGLHNVYANKVFCGWDYSIATKEAAELKSSAIYHELKELLSESREDNMTRSCLTKFYTCTVQLVVNVLILIILAGVGWICWLLLDQFSLKEDGSIIITTMAVNVIMTVLPLIFNYISIYEDYKNPRTALYITLIRTYLLGSVIIAMILAFWLLKATQNGSVDCWENRLAAEFYRLIVFDFLFSVVLTTAAEMVYAMVQKFRGNYSKSEFNISGYTLQIIYNQAMFWVAFLYSPILPALITLKMLFIWYIRKMCVQKYCKPPKQTWRAAQVQTWFMMLIFISTLLIIAVHGYTMTSIPPSQCGPFRNYDYMYQILDVNIAHLENNNTFWHIVMLVTKPGAVALLMIAVAILVYYFKEQAYAQKEKVKMLREMFTWTAKDKKYLVYLYNEVTKGGDYDILLHTNRFMDPSRVLPNEISTEINEDFN